MAKMKVELGIHTKNIKVVGNYTIQEDKFVLIVPNNAQGKFK